MKKTEDLMQQLSLAKIWVMTKYYEELISNEQAKPEEVYRFMENTQLLREYDYSYKDILALLDGFILIENIKKGE